MPDDRGDCQEAAGTLERPTGAGRALTQKDVINWGLALIGMYLTVISILLVYQVLSLQVWLGKVDDLEARVMADEERYQGAGAVRARRELKAEVERLRRQYPNVMTWLFAVVQVVLFWLGVTLASSWLSSFSWWQTVLPFVLVFSVIVLGHGTLVRDRRRTLLTLEGKVETWQRE